ncbi:MAG: SAM-dependent methyltransferase [Planctomycetaceae bacterium]|nr:SAM-dependent methyltransferase [Planctomycetaceae bacterium]
MNSAPRDLKSLLSALTTEAIVRAVFSEPAERDSEIRRVDVRPVRVRDEACLQFASRTKTQESHKNLTLADAHLELTELADRFQRVRLETRDATWEGFRKGSGTWSIKSQSRQMKETTATASAVDASNEEDHSHNQARNYLIPDGVPCPFLIETGVMTAEGKVKASHFKKFRQINRYLEFIHDVAGSLPASGLIRVVDFGCGKSYLTFATQFLLKHVLKRDCEIIGLDRRDDVVRTCQQIQSKLKLEGLSFETGEIAGFQPKFAPDLVISLHACDTATDEALAQAAKWESRVILAVPCCQKEMNRVLKGDPVPPVTSYGLTRERFCSMATDTLRAKLMEVVGYQSQVLEFIDMEHTPKNLLLRCTRRSSHTSSSSVHEIESYRSSLGIPEMTLERRLREMKLLPGSPAGSDR